VGRRVARPGGACGLRVAWGAWSLELGAWSLGARQASTDASTSEQTMTRSGTGAGAASAGSSGRGRKRASAGGATRA
jgi:hypothetical protein